MNRQTQLKIAAMTALVLLLGIFSYSAVGVESISNDTTKDVIIKNVWVDVPLSQILRDISMETGVTISSCPHVPDPIISLDASKGRPLVECLHELVAGQGLFVYQKSKKFYLIICGEITCPTTMEVASSSRVYLKYISAKHLRASLPKAVQPYVTSGERENEVFVYAEPDISAHIMEMINQMDIPSQQVMLEVLVVDLWETTSDELGIDWSFSGPHTSFSMLDGVGSAGFTGLGSYASIAASNLVSINATLRALIEKNKASIRSRPRVATLNGQKATIDISLDEYYSIITDLNGSAFRTDLQVIKSGVMLQITPFIGDDDDITVNVLTEVSDVASRQNSSGNSSTSSGDLPVIRRRKADTCVRVKEGDAIVIGGLVETQENTDHKRVPLLSSIPGAGGLFKSKQDSKTKKEVIIFITPQLIREGQEVPASERHKLINEANEIGNLRSTAFNTRNENNKKIRNTDEEIKSLNAAVNLLGSQNQTDNVSYGITDADLSNQDKTYEINRERKVLQEAINLLDDKNEQVPCITTSPKNKNEASLGAISK